MKTIASIIYLKSDKSFKSPKIRNTSDKGAAEVEEPILQIKARVLFGLKGSGKASVSSERSCFLL